MAPPVTPVKPKLSYHQGGDNPEPSGPSRHHGCDGCGNGSVDHPREQAKRNAQEEAWQKTTQKVVRQIHREFFAEKTVSTEKI